MIEDLGIETKNLQKINRDQEREIRVYHKDYGYEQKVKKNWFVSGIFKFERLLLQMRK